MSAYIFDLFFDLPHPAASPGAERARVVEPPKVYDSSFLDEMYDPEALSRIARFAFPEHDDQAHAERMSNVEAERLSVGGTKSGADLNRYDVYLHDFTAKQHTFGLQLLDGTQFFGHVRRYLPSHAESRTRADVGRRSARAMVILTRATGGERFYASVLKTVETIIIESEVVPPDIYPGRAPERAFLHALFKHHASLISEFSALQWQGGNLNFGAHLDREEEDDSAYERAKSFMYQNENLFRIQIAGLEFGGSPTLDDDPDQPLSSHQLGRGEKIIDGDFIRFYLPPSLQPGYDNIGPESMFEDIFSPIIPLLRCIGPTHMVRLLSALLCERRIVFVSGSASRLSACVRAASSMLSQGLLMWQHVLIPVLPPHLLGGLASEAPYLIGLLEPFAGIDMVPGLTDVLKVNLDCNELKTINMTEPTKTVPDLLKKGRRNRKSGAVLTVSEMLVADLEEIYEADKRSWKQEEKLGKDKSAKEGSRFHEYFRPGKNGAGKNGVSKFAGVLLGKKGKPDKVTPSTDEISLQDKPHSAASGDAAAFFGKIMRLSLPDPNVEDEPSTASEQEDVFRLSKYADHTEDPLEGQGISSSRIEACSTCENKGGEEDIRASLVCFFLHLHGDMGMYLSESRMTGTLLLNRRKFLLRKKQLGDKTNTPMFAVLRKLSSSRMFEDFVRGRIEHMGMTKRERASIMPHHVPLFEVCQKYLILNKIEFTTTNVRRLVSRTVVSCPQHSAVESDEDIRERALALTSDKPYEGNVTMAAASLVKDCRECNTALCAVMGVIWYRLGETRGSFWRHQLLALHLLKNLLLHGPLTVVAETNDCIDLIRSLRKFSNTKSATSNRTVCVVADQVCELLSDRARLFLRRRRIALAKIKTDDLQIPPRWSDYLLRRLPVTVNFRQIHVLLRPEDTTIPSVLKDPGFESLEDEECVPSEMLSTEQELVDEYTEQELVDEYAEESMPQVASSTKQYAESSLESHDAPVDEEQSLTAPHFEESIPQVSSSVKQYTESSPESHNTPVDEERRLTAPHFESEEPVSQMQDSTETDPPAAHKSEIVQSNQEMMHLLALFNSSVTAPEPTQDAEDVFMDLNDVSDVAEDDQCSTSRVDRDEAMRRRLSALLEETEDSLLQEEEEEEEGAILKPWDSAPQELSGEPECSGGLDPCADNFGDNVAAGFSPVPDRLAAHDFENTKDISEQLGESLVHRESASMDFQPEESFTLSELQTFPETERLAAKSRQGTSGADEKVNNTLDQDSVTHQSAYKNVENGETLDRLGDEQEDTAIDESDRYADVFEDNVAVGLSHEPDHLAAHGSKLSGENLALRESATSDYQPHHGYTLSELQDSETDWVGNVHRQGINEEVDDHLASGGGTYHSAQAIRNGEVLETSAYETPSEASEDIAMHGGIDLEHDGTETLP